MTRKSSEYLSAQWVTFLLDWWVDNEPCGKVLLWGTKLGEGLFTRVFGSGGGSEVVASHTSHDTRVGANGSGDQ